MKGGSTKKHVSTIYNYFNGMFSFAFKNQRITIGNYTVRSITQKNTKFGKTSIRRFLIS